jgi:flagella basal body P-ring formation protein FlgA
MRRIARIVLIGIAAIAGTAGGTIAVFATGAGAGVDAGPGTGTGTVAGDQTRDASRDLPGDVQATVRARIAEIWGTTGDRIVMVCGEPSSEIPRDTALDIRLIGKGSDGFFSAILQPAGRPTVRLVSLRVRAGINDTVAVATRPLRSGETLADGDVAGESRVVWGPPAGTEHERPGGGWEVRRAVAVGEVLAWPVAQPPQAIEAGESVRLFWRRGGVRIEVEGVALNSARIGETVRARVVGRRDRLTGTVTAPGSAVLFAGGDR